MAGKGNFAPTLYRAVFKKSSTFVLLSVVGAFFLEAAIDCSAEAIYNHINRGKLWHHIKDNYNKNE